MSAPFVHPLGLNLSEWRLIREAMGAYDYVPNGNYLPSPRWFKAATRMIERGYLTKVPDNFMPPQPDWIVIKITKENIAKYKADLAACRAGRLTTPPTPGKHGD